MKAEVFANYADLAPLLQKHTEAGRTIALTNGCFDLLHVGHIRLLQAAAQEADLLVVALNSDKSVRGNKGPGRPLVPLVERMEVLAALECVHFVTSFAEPTADALIEILRPNVYCKGTDWTADQVPERATAEKIHARIAICGDSKSHSSSDLAERLGH
ncbi:MAG: adenylyltransferase/cytidyltransferase family protein [Planctomycetota bacterium]|nr:adenylyltransferase/cytidyltransferase family protein [Planctomycetota bacterium]